MFKKILMLMLISILAINVGMCSATQDYLMALTCNTSIIIDYHTTHINNKTNFTESIYLSDPSFVSNDVCWSNFTRSLTEMTPDSYNSIFQRGDSTSNPVFRRVQQSTNYIYEDGVEVPYYHFEYRVNPPYIVYFWISYDHQECGVYKP